MLVRRVLKSCFVIAVVMSSSNLLFAESAAQSSEFALSFKSFGAILGLGIAIVGGALGQARVAAAALEGIARNPSASGKFTLPLVLGLAFIESLVLYALIIALRIAS